MNRILLGALFLAAFGCSSSRDVDQDGGPGTTFLLASSPEEPANLPSSSYRPAAILGSSVPKFSVSEKGLTLSKVLDSLEKRYPLMTAVEQMRAIAVGKAISKRGAFDVMLKGEALYTPESFFESHSVKTVLSQRTGLYGLEVFGGYRIGSGDFDPTFDGKRRTNHGGEFSSGFRLPLLEGGMIDDERAMLRQADLDIDLAQLTIQQRRIELVNQAAQAYWEWVAAGLALQVAGDLLDIGKRRQEQIRKRIKNGALRAIEGVDNERLIASREADLIVARRRFQQAGLALSLFLRDQRGQPVMPARAQLPGAFPSASLLSDRDVQRDIAQVLQDSPKLKAIQTKREQLRIETRLRKNQVMPTLDFSLLASQDLDETRPSKTKGEFELTLGLELKLPFQRRKARGKLRAARAKLRQLAEQERFVRDQIRMKVRDVFSEIQAQSQLIEQTRRNVRLSQRMADAERKAFRLGSSDLLYVNIREEYAAKARLKAIKASKSYWKALAKYRAALALDRVSS